MFANCIYILLILLVVILYRKEYRHIEFLVLFLIPMAFFPNIRWEISGSTFRLSQLVCIIVFFYLILKWRIKKVSIRINSYDVLIILFLPFLFIGSFLHSPAPLVSTKVSLLFLPFIAGYFVLRNTLNSEAKFIEALRFFQTCGSIFLYFAVIAFGLFLIGWDFGFVYTKYGSLWLKGPMMVANSFGITSVIIFYLSLFSYLSEENRGGLISMNLLGMISSLACVILSFSRSAWIGWLIGFFLSMFFFRRIDQKRYLTTIGTMVTVAFLVVFLSKNQIDFTSKVKSSFSPLKGIFRVSTRENSKLEWARLNSREEQKVSGEEKKRNRMNNSAFSQSIVWRKQTAFTAVKDWLKYPWLGSGTNSMQLRFNRQGKNFYLSTHFLLILHDWGLIAFILHILFLYSSFNGLFRNRRKAARLETKNTLSALMIILIISTFMFHSATLVHLFIFWLLYAFFASGASICLSDGLKGVKGAYRI